MSPIARIVSYACLLGSMTSIAEIKEAEVNGIDNYSAWSGSDSFAGTSVGFGGQPQPAAMPWLAQQGFKTVIALRLGEEEGADIALHRGAAERAGMRYLHLPFSPASSPPETVEGVLAAIEETDNQPVFIHCNSATRVAAIWMIGRVTRDKLTRNEAEQEGSLIAKSPDDATKFVSAYLSHHQH